MSKQMTTAVGPHPNISSSRIGFDKKKSTERDSLNATKVLREVN